MYLDRTYGPLRLDDLALWMAHSAALADQDAIGRARRRPYFSRP